MRRSNNKAVAKYRAELEGMRENAQIDVIVSTAAEYYWGRKLAAIIRSIAVKGVEHAVFLIAGFLQRHTLQMKDVVQIVKFREDLNAAETSEAALSIIRKQLHEALQEPVIAAFTEAVNLPRITSIIEEKVLNATQRMALLRELQRADANPLIIIYSATLEPQDRKQILKAIFLPVIEVCNAQLGLFYEAKAHETDDKWVAHLNTMVFGSKDGEIKGLLTQGELENPSAIIDSRGAAPIIYCARWEEQITTDDFEIKKALIDEAYRTNRRPNQGSEGFRDLTDEVIESYVFNFIANHGKKSGIPKKGEQGFEKIHKHLCELSRMCILEKCAVFLVRMDTLHIDLAYPFKEQETNMRLYKCIQQLSDMLQSGKAVDGKSKADDKQTLSSRPVTINLVLRRPSRAKGNVVTKEEHDSQPNESGVEELDKLTLAIESMITDPRAEMVSESTRALAGFTMQVLALSKKYKSGGFTKAERIYAFMSILDKQDEFIQSKKREGLCIGGNPHAILAPPKPGGEMSALCGRTPEFIG